jgi:tetratricopeptide (TPR) repeat protein
MKSVSIAFLSLLIVSVGFFSCQNEQKYSNKSVSLGTIDFPASSNEEATEHFEQGVLLLHSFMYSEAAESFRKAQELDKDFAMAYWGEAMTKNHPLWTQQYYDPGREILARLGETKEERAAKAPTDFEKDMLEGVEILFGEGTKIDRDDAYAAHFEKLYEKYPGNHEVAAFYALSLLGSVEEGRDYEVYGKGAKIAEGILAENPNHPGALHYLIHSYDDPDHASLAINAANSYSEVAPDAGHALHMPSHIYIAMGMWDDVISSNIRSYEARLKKNEKTNSNSWNLHSYHWLLYGYLQKDQTEKANEIMGRMMPYMESNQSIYSKYYGIEMMGVYMAETDDWSGEFSNTRVDASKLNVQSKASQLFLDGYQNYRKGNSEDLARSIMDIEQEISDAKNQLITRGVTVCAGTSFASRAPNQDDIDISRVLSLELKALKAMLTGEETDMVESLLKDAASLETEISFSFGPPAIVIPSYELYGRWLLEQERYDDALKQFNKSLEKGPGRRKALEGKLAAAKGLGDNELMREIELILKGQLEVS